MVSSSRHILARIPSISFPTRMIDGVRMSVSSHSTSQSKSIRKEEMRRPKSGEKKDVKVLVSEEECEIINVRGAKHTLISFSIYRAFVHTARPFPSFRDILERTLSKFRISVNMCMFTHLSRALALSRSRALSIQMGGYRPELDGDVADDDEPYKPS
jgi:hypothetical protein